MGTLQNQILVFLLLAGIASTAKAQAPASGATGGELRATYLTNEGILLEAKGRQVLVDALVGNNPDYISLSSKTRLELESAQGPFADVDLVLATHYHADHFDAGAVARHLKANRRAVFVSTPQAVAALAKLEGFEALRPRIRSSLPAEGQRQSFEDLGLEVLNLHHGRGRKPPVENLGFVIRLGAFKALHVGDTEANAKEFGVYDLPQDAIDLALLPEWIVYDSHWQGLFDQAIKPKYVMAIHLQTTYPADYGDKIREVVPLAIVPRQELETHVFSQSEPRPRPFTRKAPPR